MSLSASHEDYLRAIWKLDEWQDHPVTSGELARALGLSPSTVSEGVQRLVTKGLVRHARYGKISLTDAGRLQAARMVRIHRLLETGLVKMLGYSWDEVHEEAEHLEHAVSDTFIRRLDKALGHPTHDPHGDCIPDEDGNINHEVEAVLLSSLRQHETATIKRVADDDAETLRELSDLGLVPGVALSVTAVRRGVGLMTISVDGRDVDISITIASSILVIQS